LTDFEARLGTALLRRHDRGVEPTAAGKALLRHLGPLFDLLDGAFAEVEAFAIGARGHVRLHANASSIAGFLPELLSSFLSAHPNIEVSVQERFSVDIVHAVQTGATDLGLVSGTVQARPSVWPRCKRFSSLPGKRCGLTVRSRTPGNSPAPSPPGPPPPLQRAQQRRPGLRRDAEPRGERLGGQRRHPQQHVDDVQRQRGADTPLSGRREW
jgi:DNA-binding transcriptional LysR family regulator